MRIVQEQVSENRKRRRIRREGAKHLLQGLLVCKKCSYAYYGKLSEKKVKNGKEIIHAYYRCSGTNKHHFYRTNICLNRPIRTDVLDEAVWRDVSSLLSDPTRIEKEYDRRLADSGKSREWDSRDYIEKEIKRVKSSISRMIDAYAEGFVARDEFELRIQRFKERLARLEKHEKIKINEEEQRKTLKVIIGCMQEFSNKVNKRLHEADWELRREIICALVKRIEIDDDSVNIVYKVNPGFFNKTLQKNNGQYCTSRVVVVSGRICLI